MWQFKRLDSGPSWTVLKDNLPRRSAGEAFARDYLASHGFTLLALDYEDDNAALDIMAARGAMIEQFAVEPSP